MRHMATLTNPLTRRRNRTAVLALATATTLALAAAATAGASTPDDGDGATRTVEHALGTTEVPVDPQRIVVLDSAYVLDNVVALGYGDRIVGRLDLNGVGAVEPSWLADELDFAEIEFLGSLYPDGVDLEALAALEPDLVIGVGSAFGEQYDEISSFTAAVAPIAAEGYVVGAWDELARATGSVLDREAEAEAAIAAVEKHLEARLASAPAGLVDRSLTTIGGWLGDPPLYFSNAADAAWLFEQAGFELNPGFPDSDYELLTPERYPQLGSDVLAVADFASGGLDYAELFASDAVLRALPAVVEDQVVIVDGLLLASSGPVGMHAAIDEVFDQLEAAWRG